jgi:uncharacterized protein YbbC (DUF1343 family)/CubicO group peptidase (beta-lactamase class C family)
MIKSACLFMLSLIATAPNGNVDRGPQSLPEVPADRLGFDPDRLRRIDERIDRAIANGEVPGAVVLVGRRGKLAYVRAAGRRAVTPASEHMTRDTIFDMASLTKPVVTATAVMLLLEAGKIRLEDRVVRFLPELSNHGKDRITVEQLLRHRAGLVPDNPLQDYGQGAEAAWKRIAEINLISVPGERFRYSDVGFLILGRLVERVSGMPLDQFAQKYIFQVAGMKDAHFRPLAGQSREDVPSSERIAPTEAESPGGPILRGVVHDPRARALGGVAGHAGLFATADDLALFAQCLLDGGIASRGRRLLSPLTVRLMFDPGTTPSGERRCLGWDVATSFSSPRGALFGPQSLGHTGFTGTSLWIDPDTKTFVILLSSRLHPDGKRPAPAALRSDIATLAGAAIVDLPVPATTCPRPAPTAGTAPTVSSVACGVDVLAEDGFKTLRGQRIGLVTNLTGRTREGRSTVDVLFRAPDVRLIRLFSPEHGIRGEVDAAVPDGKDPATGLPIVSLYGSKKKPEPADMADLDALVFDIQDIGVRYYTYSTTLGLVLEAVAESRKRLVVLDRPNPLGGRVVAGPVRDPDLSSFIAYHALPVQHGMTVGELARLYDGERRLKARLDVVPCRGWSRDQTYDQTGLVWVNPSPNMRSLTEALLYPGVGWLEATNLATGRGTDTPFERVGAPWIDPVRFAAALNAGDIPGTRFVPIWFVPRERQYAGERCGGVQIMISDWSRFDSMKLGLTLAMALNRQHPRQWNPEGILKMLGDRATYQAIREGQSIAEIEELWRSELAQFLTVRAPYLLYE